MLVQIRLRNFRLIEDLSLSLARGFNVLTGETGAGKSMLVDGLCFALGARAGADVVRNGEREAEVEALFEVRDDGPVVARLRAAGIPYEGDLIVRRTMQVGGRGRAYVNGRLTPVSELAALTRDLCDVASQHESMELTNPSAHIDYLDAHGGLADKRAIVARGYDEMASLAESLTRLDGEVAKLREREDYMRFQLSEIVAVSPRAGEEEELARERTRLRHAGKLQERSQQASQALSDGETPVTDVLARVAAMVDEAARLDPTLEPLVTRLENAKSEIDDVGHALARYAEATEANEARLGELEERLFRLQKLCRSFGPSASEVVAAKERLERELETVLNADAQRATILARIATLRASIEPTLRELSASRRKAAVTLGVRVGKELGRLGMTKARLEVRVEPLDSVGDNASEPHALGTRLTRSGIDRVEMLIATSAGEPAKPLRRVASGGELSRALLALKSVLIDTGATELSVFDEIDTGTSGAVADAIGRTLKSIGKHRQIIAITHLAQVAARADVHLVVDRLEQGDERARIAVRKLTRTQRVGEIARMIGGLKVGKAAHLAAEELLAVG